MNIDIEEMPQGCVLSMNGNGIVVDNLEDALAIIKSLYKMIKTQFPDSIHESISYIINVITN